MGTSAIRSVAIRQETTFGSVVSTTGIPGTAGGGGGSFIGLECDRADLATIGDMPANPVNRSRSRVYELPAEPDTVWSGGARVHRRTGTLTLTVPWRGIGDGTVYALTTSLPLYWLLHSSMAADDAVGHLHPANAGVISTTSFEIATGTLPNVGQMFVVDINGRRESARVTRVNVGAGTAGADVITYSPATTAPLISTHTLRMGSTLYAPIPGTVGESLSIRLDGDGWRTYAYGCRVSAWALVLDGRRASIRCTVQCAFVIDDHSAAAIADPPIADGAWAHLANTDPVYTLTLAGLSAPAALARNLLDIGSIVVEYAATLAPKGTSHSAVGITDLEVAQWTAKVGMTLATPISAFDRDLLDGVRRSLMIPFGPCEAGAGGSIYLPAATPRLDASKRDLSGELVSQVLEWGAGPWAGDYSTTGPGGSNFSLLLAAG